ncbi:hypothetical protein HYS31_08065 [Candidatus Woesearchaeota archaeon]|nr:hypothetical protein [Candidatus Woesearchaeota archaeon]
MRFQKAIKRMIALGTGAIMLSSMAGAAVDLANYPMPFVKDGKFSGVLIVGDKAASADVIGVSDIISSLQFAASKKVATTAPGTTTVEGDAWQVATSNHLELSEDGNSNDHVETLRNITSYIDKNNLKALASGSATNSKATSPYNQYFYLLGPGAETALNTGYVIYTEDDADVTADFLYFKSGKEIGRYLIEFTTSLESDVDDSAGSSSATGLFLTDFENVDLTMFGKKYSIVAAKRLTTNGQEVELTMMGGSGKDTLLEKATKTYDVSGKPYEVTLTYVGTDGAQFTINGQNTRKLAKGDTDKLSDGTTVGVSEILFQNFAGGIHSATFYIGANKLVLKDTAITDTGSSNQLKVDDNTIDDAQVIIEGTNSSSTFKINRIHVNMTADDNFFVPAGGKLSEAIKKEGGTSAEPQVLFTQNWDIEYRGLKNVNTEKIRVKTSGSSQYNLEFVDGDGYKVDVPIAKAQAASSLIFGDQGKEFINVENQSITRDDYFVVTDGSRKRGERKSYVLQYKGADKVTADNPVLKFRKLGEDKTIEQTFSAGTTDTPVIATLKIGGADFRVYNTSSIAVSDFNLRVDMDASGALSGINDSHVNITTRYGAEIGLRNTTIDGLGWGTGAVMLTVKTPDEARDGSSKDSVENIQAKDYAINITADSSTKVTFVVLSGQTSGQNGDRIAERTPDGKTNIQYGYTSYGAFVTRETPTSDPPTLSIDYPESQRYAQVYIAAKGASFSESGATTSEAVTVQRIQVGAAKLASEVADVKAQNSILVGGPCANKAAATVLGDPVDCTEGFEPGVGRIELFEHANGNVAMLVAGYGAVDTRNAAAVVANYADYKGQLKGAKVKVTKGVGNVLTVA